MPSGRLERGSGVLPLADAYAPASVHALDLLRQRKEIDDRANSKQPECEKPEHATADLAEVEVLNACGTQERKQHERVGDTGLFFG